MLALDVDGTTVRPDRRLSRRVAAAVQRAIDAGLHVVLVTGRNWFETEELHRRLGLTAPAVCCNGGHIVSAAGQDLHRQTLPPAVAARAAEVALAEGDSIVFAQGGHFLLAQADHARQMWRREWLGWRQLGAFLYYLFREFPHMPVRSVPDLPAALREEPLAFCIASTVKNGRPIGLAKANRMRAALSGEPVQVVATSDWSVDVLNPDVNKGRGLAAVAARLGCTASEVVAVGDGMNDVDMLRWAGLGIAMGNAPTPVREAADLVTASNNDDGVAVVIDQLLAGELAAAAASGASASGAAASGAAASARGGAVDAGGSSSGRM